MQLQLLGRVIITGVIEVKTGLHIGGSGGAFAIGGVDNPGIKDPLTKQPYIPGSSLRGKMRSLTEKYQGRTTGQRISQVEIHACQSQDAYAGCPICNIYGIAAQDFNLPTRLVIRDVPLQQSSAEALSKAKMGLPFTDVKTEVAIDRVTSQATPRDVERVPAGAVFHPLKLVYSIYIDQDVDWFKVLVDGMELLEDDYLGGMGSRGNGQIAFRSLSVRLKGKPNYRSPAELGQYDRLPALSADTDRLVGEIYDRLFGNGA